VRLSKAEMIALAEKNPGACPVSWYVRRHHDEGRHRRGAAHCPMPSGHHSRSRESRDPLYVNCLAAGTAS
jgi:hypothetical protein